MTLKGLHEFEVCPIFSLTQNHIHWKGTVYCDITNEYIERYLTNYTIRHPKFDRYGDKISDAELGYMDVVTGLIFDAHTGVCTKSSRITLDLKSVKNNKTTKTELLKILRGAGALIEEETA